MILATGAVILTPATGALAVPGPEVTAAAAITAAAAVTAHHRDHLLHLRHLAHLRHLLDGRTDGRAAAAVPSVPSARGALDCRELESLWLQAGGSQGEALTAAEIAMAESGGNQFATGTVGERGYWQINPNHGSLSTYDPMGNAKAAVILSADGTNWTPWTTYTSGLYIGRC